MNKHSSSRRWTGRLIVIAALTAMLFTTVWLVERWQQDRSIAVQRVQASRQSIVDALLLEGRVINDQTVHMGALIDGEITAVAAREGKRVKAGELLATIDTEHALATRDRARAALALEREKLRVQRSSHERTLSLAATSAVSIQELDQSTSQLAQLQQRVAAAQADLDAAALQVRNATLRAPFDGLVMSQGAEVGQWVEAGTELFVVVGAQGYVIEAYVDAEHIDRLELDQPVSLRSEASPDTPWSAAVSWIGPEIATHGENGHFPNSVAIRIPLADAQAQRMRLGQRIDVDLVLERRDDALTLPLTALVESAPGQYGVWLEQNGRAHWRDITLGLVTHEHAEVMDGLNGAEVAIIALQSPLREGMAVSDGKAR